jgi:hypothetical protein
MGNRDLQFTLIISISLVIKNLVAISFPFMSRCGGQGLLMIGEWLLPNCYPKEQNCQSQAVYVRRFLRSSRI